MVSVTISSKLRSIYKRKSASKLEKTETCSSQGNEPATGRKEKKKKGSAVKRPITGTRLMRPGQRALSFQGMCLLSGQSDGRLGNGRFELEIYQKADETFIVMLNRVDKYETLRLIMTREAPSINELKGELYNLDAAKYVSFAKDLSRNVTMDETAGLFEEITGTIELARAEYIALLNEIFLEDTEQVKG